MTVYLRRLPVALCLLMLGTVMLTVALLVALLDLFWTGLTAPSWRAALEDVVERSYRRPR